MIVLVVLGVALPESSDSAPFVPHRQETDNLLIRALLTLRLLSGFSIFTLDRIRLEELIRFQERL
jgi:hypothetical protein